jgi:hypothetical protein
MSGEGAETQPGQKRSRYPGLSVAFNPGITATGTEIDRLKAGDVGEREEKSRPRTQQGRYASLHGNSLSCAADSDEVTDGFKQNVEIMAIIPKPYPSTLKA